MTDLYELISTLVAADEESGSPGTFTLFTSAGGPVIAGRDLPEGARVPTHVEVDEMRDRGWVRVTDAEGKGRTFAVTSAGRAAAARWSASRAGAGPGPSVDLEWSAVSGVLAQVYQAYVTAGAPENGVDTTSLDGANDPTSKAAVRELARAGYLEDVLEIDGLEVPRLVRPTPLALERVAGWPGSSAQAALDDLVAAIDTEIARTSDSEKRSALVTVRDGLVGAARDFALAYLEKKAGV